MSYDLKLNSKQKLWCSIAALERLKDAPLTLEESSDIIKDTLHLINYGSYQITEKNWYANILLKSMPKGPHDL